MTMEIEIREELPAFLGDYARIRIAYEVDRVLEVSTPDDGVGGIALVERPVAAPWLKDYDALPGQHPTDWGRRFDISSWGIFSASVDGRVAGGAAVAFATAGVDMMEGRHDLAVLWDIRVAPGSRARGIGTALEGRVERWATERGARRLKVETQNVNVAACRFYARRGFELRAIHRFAYPELPGETQLLWYKDLMTRA